jgi:mRNA-degrading endonuclease RelE of RelBE toxin-antitoxin system
MKRFTVVWFSDAQDDLANLWMNATDRSAVARSADEIDLRLAHDPISAVEEEHEGLCSLRVGPLVIQYSFDESDRRVTVWTVRQGLK